MATLPLVGPASSDRIVRDVLAGVRNGRINVADRTSVTLRASQTTTTLTDTRIRAESVILLMPTTANAAGALSGLYVSARDSGTATLTHASTAAVDKTFGYAILG